MQIITTIHGYWRWLVALLAIVILAKYLIGLITQRDPEKIDATLARAFAGVLGIQFILGMVNLIGVFSRGGFARQIGEHAFTGLIAVGLGSMVAPMLRRRGSYLVPLILVVLTLLLAIVNVASIRGNWFYN